MKWISKLICIPDPNPTALTSRSSEKTECKRIKKAEFISFYFNLY